MTTAAATPANAGDAARDFSLQLLDVFAEKLDRLGIDPADEFPEPDVAWDGRVLRSMREALHDLERANAERDRAESALRDFGSRYTQTTMIGLAPNFPFGVRMGLLLGQRTILWDATVLPFLEAAQAGDNRSAGFALRSAWQFLQWREVARQGGVVVLPHPRFWIPECERDLAAFARTHRRNFQTQAEVDSYNNSLGLINASSLMKRALPLQPYVVQHQLGAVPVHGRTVKTGPAGIPAEELAHQADVQALLAHPEFAFLQSGDHATFHRTLRDAEKACGHDLALRLAEMLRKFGGGSGDPQWSAKREQAIREILAGIEARNLQLSRYVPKVAATAVATSAVVFGVVGSTVAYYSDQDAASLMGAIAAILGLHQLHQQWIEAHSSKDPTSVVFAAFAELKRQSGVV